MLDKEKRFAKVIAFYQSLPKELLEKIIQELPINRDNKRKLFKVKSTNDKVKKLLGNTERLAKSPKV